MQVHVNFSPTQLVSLSTLLKFDWKMVTFPMVLSFGGKHLKRPALLILVLIKMLSLIPPLLMVLRFGAMLFFAYWRKPYRAFFYSCLQFHGCKCCKCTFVLQISFIALRLALD